MDLTGMPKFLNAHLGDPMPPNNSRICTFVKSPPHLWLSEYFSIYAVQFFLNNRESQPLVYLLAEYYV